MAARGLLVSLAIEVAEGPEVGAVGAAGEETAGTFAPVFSLSWHTLAIAAGMTMLLASKPASSVSLGRSLKLLSIIRLMIEEHMNCHSPVLLGAIGLIAPNVD
jgi:hypothetical protein